MSLKKKLATGLTLAATLVLAACGAANNSTTSSSSSAASSTASSATAEKTVVKVGLYGEKNEAWDYLKPVLEEKENIVLEFVNFTDYVAPNLALADGSVDINAFQTIAYLEKFNEEHKTEIVSVGYTFLQPLGIYSEKIKDLSEVKEGDVVVIPDGASNGGRALRLLQAAGLIKVDPSKGVLPTISDITENRLNLDIKEVDASQTVRSLQDVTIAIANGDVALDGGKVPTTDALFLEAVNEDSKPYYNVIAATESTKDKPVFATIVKYFQTDEVKKVLEEATKGASIPVWEEAQ